MKRYGLSVRGLELTVIIAVSLAASYALLGTSTRSLIPFAALALLGVLTVIVLPIGTIFFGAGAVIMTLPALMKVNGVEWWVLSAERLAFCPTLNLPAAMAIGLFVVSGGLFLGCLYPLQRQLKTLQRGQADVEETRRYSHNQLRAVGAAIVASAGFAAIVILMIAVMRENLGRFISEWPWTLPAGGFAFLVLLALSIFWLISVRK